MNYFYRLDEDRVPHPTDEAGGIWVQVALSGDKDKVWISTVFMGIDHNFTGSGRPILFETMVFGLPDTEVGYEYQRRCSTWDEAVQQHKEACKFAGIEPRDEDFA